jgi:hypothetical protein
MGKHDEFLGSVMRLGEPAKQVPRFYLEHRQKTLNTGDTEFTEENRNLIFSLYLSCCLL